jgi:hypothetical protein
MSSKFKFHYNYQIVTWRVASTAHWTLPSPWSKVFFFNVRGLSNADSLTPEDFILAFSNFQTLNDSFGLDYFQRCFIGSNVV